MSQRAPGGRTRRPDRSNSSDSRSDTRRPKSDGKESDPRTVLKNQQQSVRTVQSRPVSSKEVRPKQKNDQAARHGTEEKRSKSDRSSESKVHQTETLRNGGFSRNEYSREYVNTDIRKSGSAVQSKAFQDDSRLSRTVRRLIRDDDREKRIIAAKQLKEHLAFPENIRSAIAVAESLLDTLCNIFTERTYKDVKLEVVSCIGRVGSVMGRQVHRYFSWLFSKLSSVTDEEVCIHLLKALYDTIMLDEKRLLLEYMQMVIDSCQRVLEGADSPDLLVAIMDVILLISSYYPQPFASHFRDTVDILVGWHIDSTQNESLIQYTSDALVAFHPFWVGDLNFSVTLLGQFLEDIEAYSEDLCIVAGGQQHLDDEMPTIEECLTKLSALTRVFCTVVKSIGDTSSPQKSQILTVSYLVNTIERLVKSIDDIRPLAFSEEVYQNANQCLLLLINLIDLKQSSQLVSLLLPYIQHQLDCGQSRSNAYILALLDLIHEVVHHVNTQLPTDFIAVLMGPTSLFQSLKCSHDKQITSHLMRVYHAIMGLKSVPLLTSAYKYVLSEIQVTFSSLCKTLERDSDLELVTENIFDAITYKGQEIETMIVFNFCVLSEIGNTKSNLIGMYALTPSFFTLMMSKLQRTCMDIAVFYPAVHYAWLYALHSHSFRHEHFISSSDLISKKSPSGTTLSYGASNTGGHFTLIINLLTDIFSCKKMPLDSRKLSLKWLFDILKTLESSPDVLTCKQFHSLLNGLILQAETTEQDVCLNAAVCIEKCLMLTTRFPSSFLRSVLETCFLLMLRGEQTMKLCGSRLLQLLPVDVILKCDGSIDGTMDKNSSSWLARRFHQSKMPTGTFHSHNFKAVMGFILHGLETSCNGIYQDSWLERIFHSSQRSDKDKRDAYYNLPDLIDGNKGLLWFWSTWEAAQFCVLAKLRTPLGKPQETFTEIEAVIKLYALDVKTRKEDSVEKYLTYDEIMSTANTGHLRASLLLNFMENLEKVLYNAYEGCAVALTTAPKAVRTFFRTNRNTCSEWLTRVRYMVVMVASHCGQPTTVIRQGCELLRELADTGNLQSSESEQVIVYVVKALVSLGLPEPIQGLYAWYKEMVSQKLSWLKPAIDKASRRYEKAADHFKTCLVDYLKATESVQEVEEIREQETVSPSTSPRLKTGSDAFSKRNNMSDPIITGWMIDEVTDCYLKLNDWSEFDEWQAILQSYQEEYNSLQVNTTVDLSYIRALSKFDNLAFSEAGEYLDLIPGISVSNDDGILFPVSWDLNRTLEIARVQFLQGVTNFQCGKDIGNVSSHFDVSVKLCEDLLCTQVQDFPPLVNSEVMTLMLSAKAFTGILDQTNKTPCLLLSNEFKVNAEDDDVGTYNEAIRVTRLQQDLVAETVSGISAHLSRLRLSTAGLARKQQNYRLSQRLLISDIQSVLRHQSGAADLEADASLVNAVSSLVSCNGAADLTTTLTIEREAAKLLYATNQCQDAISVLGSSIARNLVIHSQNPLDSTSRELNARSVLTLVKWLQADQKNLTSLVNQLKLGGQGDESTVSEMHINLKVMLGFEKRFCNKDEDLCVIDHEFIPQGDLIIGRLLHFAPNQCDTLAKTWFAFAGWCFKWGRKAIDNASHGCIKLSSEEISKITAILPEEISSDEKETILNIMGQINTVVSSEEDIVDQDQSFYDDGADVTRKQLANSCPIMQLGSSEILDQLLGVWTDVVKRVYHYYELSAKSYFTYLTLKTDTVEDNEDGNITATLRLLRMLVKHAWELRGILEVGLAETPTTPWKGIIPQLFSRLSHPETYVRQSVSDLLCRVAQDVPHMIVYSAVVGCSGGQNRKKDVSRDGILNDYLAQSLKSEGDQQTDNIKSQEDEPTPGGSDSATTNTPIDSQEETRECSDISETDVLEETLNADDQFEAEVNLDNEVIMEDQAEEEEGDEQMKSLLQDHFSAIVDTLAQHNPKMISEVQLLVGELRRITLLWDELWLGTLNQHHQDVTRRISQLENEVKKVMNNTSLSKEEKTAIIREKHDTVLKPTLYSMVRLQAITSRPSETPHERWFQETYGSTIDSAVERLRNPTTPSNPQQSWLPFKQLHHSLQQRSQKRSSFILKMDEISPKLTSDMKGTVIAMPGLGSGKVVTVESIYHTAQILPTKTKPKKLVFIGSDGKKYPYLFKGLEDLHLDERIMQFLSIVNNMLVRSAKGEKRLHQARHYSVTPLGSRSGLIQWVDGALPLFGLYKRWQQREASYQALKAQASGHTSSANPNNIPRPSEVFYSKMNPALKERGIKENKDKDTDSRKEWPLYVMREVLEDLMNDTPSDLLAREIWCSSTSAREWWDLTQRYCRSTAVMSMIGYIIGLGDRHLDNVLVDFQTGEVVHIDYNVCFEKGRSLRVPEKVPFRMTPNIETALGVTGVEGTFRLSSEHVIKTMRKGRETLLTLLEAFVYDPLVDWTTGNDGGFAGAFYGGNQVDNKVQQPSKAEMDREISFSMFSIRITEMKKPWLKNRDELKKAVVIFEESLGELEKSQVEMETYRVNVDRLTEVQQLLEEALCNKEHSIYTLHNRYEEFASVKNVKDSVQDSLQEKLNECEHWQKLHEYTLQSIKGPFMQQMFIEMSKPFDVGVPSFAPTIDFLQGAGKGQLVTQGELLEEELSTLLIQRRELLRRSLEILHSYTTLVSYYPASFIQQNRSFTFGHWLHGLLCDFTLNKCQETAVEFAELYQPTSVHPSTEYVLTVDLRLQSQVHDANERLLKLIDRRNSNLEEMQTNVLRQHVQETGNKINHFLQEYGLQGTTSITSVIVTALCALNKRYLIMEGAAAAAGDRLMDLTSRDGDWFLEELCSMSGNINELLGLIRGCPVGGAADSSRIQHCLVTMEATNVVYVTLQELNMNFRTIIIPESQKIIQSQEASFMDILSELEEISTSSTMPLDTVLEQLELMLLNTIMEIEHPDTEPLAIAGSMQRQYTNLLAAGDSSELTSGKMLLMALNGLFTKLDGDFSTMLQVMSELEVPVNWGKIDVIKEAKGLQRTSFNETTRHILSDIFFLKRLEAMKMFFQLCQQMSLSLQDFNGGEVYDDEQLCRPIKQFVAEFIRKQVIGLPSQILGYVLCSYIKALGVDVTAEIHLKDIGAAAKVAIDDLCKKAVDSCIKKKAFQHLHLTNASSLISTHDTAWRKLDLARRLDNNIILLKSSLERSQIRMARYQWLFEDIYTQSAARIQHQMAPPTRGSIMSEIRKNIQALMTQEGSIPAVIEKYTMLEASISQRLKWGLGANPSLHQIMEQFEAVVANRAHLFESESYMTTEIIKLGNALLHFEAMRTKTQEALAADGAFITLLSRCEEACNVVESCTSFVSDLEEKLIEKTPLVAGSVLDAAWLQTALEQNNKDMTDLGEHLDSLREHMDAKSEDLKSKAVIIRTLLAGHNRLMVDVKSILKSLAKMEEQEEAVSPIPGEIRAYLTRYKGFSERFTAILKLANLDEICADVIQELTLHLSNIGGLIDSIYNDLIDSAPVLKIKRDEPVSSSTSSSLAGPSFASVTAPKKSADVETGLRSTPHKMNLVLQNKPELFTGTPPTSSPQSVIKLATPVKKAEKVTRDPKTGKAIQERNSYAVSVWRKVKYKLDGRDPDPNKRYSVAEQVDYVIREATDLDNLAVLYEGWTPWV